MSLFNYFAKVPENMRIVGNDSRQSSSSSTLPRTVADLNHDSLSSLQSISTATHRETEEVQKQLEQVKSRGKKRGRYRSWKPEERSKIGKYAHLHGNKSTLVKFRSEFHMLNHQSVTDFKKLYEEEIRTKDKDITELGKKKQGRPTILPEYITRKTMEMVVCLRLKGAPLNSTVLNAVAKGIVMANDRSLFLEYGGHISLNNDWARKILYKMECESRKMVRRMGTTAKIPIAPAIHSEIKLDFQRKFKCLLEWHEISLSLVINFDQTPLPYVCSSNQTLEERGKKDIPIKGKGKKKQITGIFAISMTGFSPNTINLSRKNPKVST